MAWAIVVAAPGALATKAIGVKASMALAVSAVMVGARPLPTSAAAASTSMGLVATMLAARPMLNIIAAATPAPVWPVSPTAPPNCTGFILVPVAVAAMLGRTAAMVAVLSGLTRNS